MPSPPRMFPGRCVCVIIVYTSGSMQQNCLCHMPVHHMPTIFPPLACGHPCHMPTEVYVYDPPCHMPVPVMYPSLPYIYLCHISIPVICPSLSYVHLCHVSVSAIYPRPLYIRSCHMPAPIMCLPLPYVFLCVICSSLAPYHVTPALCPPCHASAPAAPCPGWPTRRQVYGEVTAGPRAALSQPGASAVPGRTNPPPGPVWHRPRDDVTRGGQTQRRLTSYGPTELRDGGS